MLVVYKFGLLIHGLKPYFTSTLTESTTNTEDESEELIDDVKVLYKSQELKVVKINNDTVEIYLYSDAKKDLVYYVTIIESLLRNEKFEGNKVKFRIYVDEKLVDEFVLNLALLAAFSDALLHNASKIDATDRSVLKTLNNLKLDPNKEIYTRMVLLKGELKALDKNTAFSFSLKQAVKQNDKTLIEKIKEFMTMPMNIISKVYRAIVSYVYSFKKENIDLNGYLIKLESFTTNDRYGSRDNYRNNRNDRYRNNDRERSNYRDNYGDNRYDRDDNERGNYRDSYRDNKYDRSDRENNNFRERQNSRGNRRRDNDRVEKPSREDKIDTQKLMISYVVSVIVLALINIGFGSVANIIEKLFVLALGTFSIYVTLDRFDSKSARRKLDQKMDPKMAYFISE